MAAVEPHLDRLEAQLLGKSAKDGEVLAIKEGLSGRNRGRHSNNSSGNGVDLFPACKYLLFDVMICLAVVPLRQIRLFLQIAREPDQPLAKYARLIDLAPGGPSARHFAALRSADETEGHGTKKLRHSGLGLIETYPDPNDKRNQLARLSRRGEEVRDSIVDFIEEDATYGQQYRVREYDQRSGE